MSGAALTGGYLADVLLGDPRRLHPVAGFGLLAQHVESVVYAPTRARGVACTALLTGLAAGTGELAARAAARAGANRSVVLAVVTWASLGGRALTCVGDRLADHLQAGELVAARETLPSLCGRDPQALDADGLARAVLESVAENTSDAVVGALFWGAVAGPAGVMGYRATNTLDAMVGHRSEQQTYIYRPAVKPAKVRESALRQLVKTFFDGSAASAATALLGLTKGMNEEELNALQRAIDEAKERQS